MNAPAVTIVHGIPGNSAHGFASIQSQLVNATAVLIQPIKISRINSIKNSMVAEITLVICKISGRV